MNTTLCLTVYAIVVAVTAPRWLRRVTGQGRMPRLEIAAWLLAIVSSTGCLLFALATFAEVHNDWLAAVGWAMLATILARVTWAISVTWRETRDRRRKHGELLAILGRPDPGLNAIIVDAPEPLVYCLPSPRPTVVVTSAARGALTPIQLSAALAHEHAHLTGRHHLLLTVLQTAARTAPWLALFDQASTVVSGLLEMRADDAAANRYGPRTVAAAIAAMSRRPAPTGALGAAGPTALRRGLRLCAVESRWRIRAGRIAVVVTTLSLALGPYLFNMLPLCPTRW